MRYTGLQDKVNRRATSLELALTEFAMKIRKKENVMHRLLVKSEVDA
jgi:hypothetical protein